MASVLVCLPPSCSLELKLQKRWEFLNLCTSKFLESTSAQHQVVTPSMFDGCVDM